MQLGTADRLCDITKFGPPQAQSDIGRSDLYLVSEIDAPANAARSSHGFVGQGTGAAHPGPHPNVGFCAADVLHTDSCSRPARYFDQENCLINVGTEGEQFPGSEPRTITGSTGAVAPSALPRQSPAHLAGRPMFFLRA